MVDNEKIYQALIKEWGDDWIETGQPLEKSLPTLNSYIASAPPFSKPTLLSGQLLNLQMFYQSWLDSDGTLSKIEYDQDVPSILEVACGLTTATRSEVLMARVASYASPPTRDEANAVALSLFLRMRFSNGQVRDVNCRKMRNEIVLLTGVDAERFLAPLIYATCADFKLEGVPDILVMSSVRFWRRYGEWRTSFPWRMREAWSKYTHG